MQYDYIVKHTFSLVEYDPQTHEQINSRNFERGDLVTGDDARAIEKDPQLLSHVRRITPRQQAAPEKLSSSPVPAMDRPISPLIDPPKS